MSDNEEFNDIEDFDGLTEMQDRSINLLDELVPIKDGDKLTKAALERFLEDSWLGINVNENELFNPMDFVFNGTVDNREVVERLSYLMSQPEYFYFTCKYILNIELLPFQTVILQELWGKKFPMLIGSRGLGKAEPITTPILTSNGWVKMGDIKVGNKTYGRDGKLHNVTAIHPQGKKQICRLTFADGRIIDCCEDHLWVVKKGNGKERVLSTKEIIKDGCIWKGPSDKYAYKYKVPHCDPIEFTKNDLPIDPYILGCLLGDGTMNTKTPKIASDDEFIAQEFKNRLEGFEVSQDPTNNNYTLVDRNKDYTEVTRGASKYLCRTRNRLTDKIEALGLSVGCKGKFIPDQYKYSSIEDRMEIVRGLLDTDGSVNNSGSIEFTNTCEKLVDDLIEILRSLGISCIKSNDNREGQAHVLPSGKESTRGFYYRVYINTSNPVFKLPRKLERIKANSTGREKYNAIVAAEYIEEYTEMQCITVDSPDHTYITKDYVVTHNSFILAVYSILRCLLMPRRKIIVVGAAFRQSKVIFEYMETIWKNAPVLRDLCDSNSGPYKDIDRCVMKINGGTVTCLPLGDGQKIRGQRAHDIINDEFSCLDKDSLVETTNGFIRINDFNRARNCEVYTGNNQIKTEKPFRYIQTPLTDVYEIKLKNGYTIKCSENHQVMTNNGWKKPLDLTSKDYIEESSNFNFGESIPNGLTKDLCWLMGILVSEGSICDKKNIVITTTDYSLAKKISDKFKWNISARDEYIDSRYGWKCKKCYFIYTYNEQLRNLLYSFGLDYVTSHNKKIPEAILTSPKEYIIAFLNGLFDGDGSCFLWKNQAGKNNIGLAYYSVSERLCRDVQIIMNKLGYDGFLGSRKSKISKNLQWFVRWSNKQAKDAAIELNIDRFSHIVSQCIVPDDSKNISWDKNRNKWAACILYCGQRIYKRFTNLKDAQDFISDIKGKIKYRQVASVKRLNYQDCLYDYYLPQTNSFYADGYRQHNSMPREIFENVVAGFAAVSASPLENVKRLAKEKAALQKNVKIKDKLYTSHMANQIVLAGTAYYEFNHFAQEWKKYKRILDTKGDKAKIRELLKVNDVGDFNYNDYTILRIPVTTLPEGFMDAAQINRARATVHSGIFQMEYGSVFTSDSQGFFKRSLIESCTCSPDNVIRHPSGDVNFDAALRGSPDKTYVYGIDPASEVDNFSIVVLEVNKDHRRLVYCWTTTRTKHKEQLKTGLIDENDFYSYCCRKIRNLMKVFPCREIALDSQGGGVAIIEGLHDKDKIRDGELPIWPTIEPDKEKDTDDMPGLHIVQMCNFAKADWLGEANHGLRKDLEDKVMLFPYFDTVSLGLSLESDKRDGRVYDTLEDCFMEIEELKNELSMITVTLTPSGREHWDTPSTKVATGKKDKLRKDRYSALIMANMSARQTPHEVIDASYYSTGGFAQRSSSDEEASKDYYIGPHWFTREMEDLY
jgi:intein/homing endonuclease